MILFLFSQRVWNGVTCRHLAAVPTGTGGRRRRTAHRRREDLAAARLEQVDSVGVRLAVLAAVHHPASTAHLHHKARVAPVVRLARTEHLKAALVDLVVTEEVARLARTEHLKAALVVSVVTEAAARLAHTEHLKAALVGSEVTEAAARLARTEHLKAAPVDSVVTVVEQVVLVETVAVLEDVPTAVVDPEAATFLLQMEATDDLPMDSEVL